MVETLRALDLGGPELFWLDGGGFRLDGGAMFGPVARRRWSSLYPPAEDNTVPLTAHVVMVQDGPTYGLLDSGFGHHLSDRQRRFYSLERETQLEHGLAELGISPNRIDWVVLSHLHLDHAGGITNEHGATFPNAAVWVQALEVGEAHDETNRAHGVYTAASFDRLRSLGLIREANGAASVTDAVEVALTGGHSRGHQVTLVRGTHAAMLHMGELLVTQHHLSPAWVSALDDFPLDTIRAKRDWLGRAANRRWWVTFSHDVSATAGRLDPTGKLAELRLR